MTLVGPVAGGAGREAKKGCNFFGDAGGLVSITVMGAGDEDSGNLDA